MASEGGASADLAEKNFKKKMRKCSILIRTADRKEKQRPLRFTPMIHAHAGVERNIKNAVENNDLCRFANKKGSI